MEKIVSWFSAGVTSAVATKLALEKFKNIDIIFFETGAHHPDTERFLQDCEKWYQQDIQIVQNPEYGSLYDVLEKGYINSPQGAFCTYELKKKMRWELEKEYNYKFQVFGFEYDKKEINRAIRFIEQYENVNPIFPLIENKINKSKSIYLLEQVGIEIPMMYKLGYSNNNCVGCVKGGMGYWNKIRVDFPDVFAYMAQLERRIGATCLKEMDKNTGENVKLYLDELNPNRGHKEKPLTGDCGVICATEFNDILSPKVEQILNGKLKIDDLVRRFQ